MLARPAILHPPIGRAFSILITSNYYRTGISFFFSPSFSHFYFYPKSRFIFHQFSYVPFELSGRLGYPGTLINDPLKGETNEITTDSLSNRADVFDAANLLLLCYTSTDSCSLRQ